MLDLGILCDASVPHASHSSVRSASSICWKQRVKITAYNNHSSARNGPAVACPVSIETGWAVTIRYIFTIRTFPVAPFRSKLDVTKMGNRSPRRTQLDQFAEEEEVKSPPRSDLCPVSISLNVAWQCRNGDRCAAPARTLLVNRKGATIVLQQKLDATQEITISSVGTGRRSLARVVGLIGQESEGQVYGISLTDPAAAPWAVELAQVGGWDVPETEYFLECAVCLTCAQIRLDSIEAKVFGARRVITLLCPECNKWTVWGLASCEARTTRDPEATPQDASEPAPRVENRRKHGRISTKLSACIRSAGAQLEEVVRVTDISRGGFRFHSPNHYPEGSRLLVAMPFTPNASNVFVPVRVMWRKEVRRLKRYEYGVAYDSLPKPSSTARRQDH